MGVKVAAAAMETIPIPETDQHKPMPDLRIRTFFIVDDALDEDVLRKALERLICDHWRKLGARIVPRKDGFLEYHLPKVFPDEYELFRWSSTEYVHSFDEFRSKITPAAEQKGVEFLSSMHEIDTWFRPSDCPFNWSGDPPNSPILYVHLSLFTDATVIFLSIPHVVVDQLGKASIMRAWLGLVEGKQPPPMHGTNEDILPGQTPFHQIPKDKAYRKGKIRVRRPLENFFVTVGLIPEIICHPKEEAHILFFPHSLTQSLRERCVKQLEKAHKGPVVLTDGDVLTAILTKLHRIHDKKTRTLTLSQPINLRGRTSRLIGPEKEGFIHNALLLASSRFRVNADTPLAEIAHHSRQTIVESADEKELETLMAITREMVRRGQPQHICEPFERSYFVINWVKAWADIDMTAAVKDGARERKEGRRVKMRVYGKCHPENTPSRYATTIMCKTEEGYFADFWASQKTMKLLKEYIARDPMLEKL